MEKLTKEKVSELMKTKGETRGVSLKCDWDHVYNHRGEEAIRKLEAKMTELGCPLKYKEIRVTDFYPIGVDAISMLVIAEMFDMKEKDFAEVGAEALQSSIFLRVFMKYFLSVERVMKEAPKIWEKHYTLGRVEFVEYNKEKHYIAMRLHNFAIHPIYCKTFLGYFAKIAEIVVRSPVFCKETKCIFNGDPYHEFIIQW